MTKSVVYGPAHRDEGYAVVGERIHVLAHGDETGAGEAFIQEGPPGMGPPPHMHPWDEAYLMLEGEMDVLVGERKIHMLPGMYVYIPAGTVHNFCYTTPGRFFSYTSGAGAAKFFAELDRDAPELPPNIPRILEIAGRNRVSVPPPPRP
jgi:mannose-6-phosphate isomerase-like protein (cupin superfamily)